MSQQMIVLPYDEAMRPVRTARGAMTRRQGFWLGRVGERGCAWGEVATWPGFGAGLEACQKKLCDREQAWLDVLGPTDNSDWPIEIAGAVAQAELVAEAMDRGVPLCRLLNPHAAVGIQTHALVDSAYSAQQAVSQGAQALKVKVGLLSLDEEGAKIMALRSAVGPDIRLRLDANGSYPTPVATQAARLFAAASPEWFEQPVDAEDVLGLAHVRKHGGVPIYADEALLGEASLLQLHAAQAIDGVVIKPAFVGGPKKAFLLGQKAFALGLGVCVTHALESPVGRLGALHVALALGPQTAAGLGGGLFEQHNGPWQHRGYTLGCPRTKGLGLVTAQWSPPMEPVAF